MAKRIDAKNLNIYYGKFLAVSEVSFTINTNSGNEMREQACEFIRTDLGKIGIKVNYLPLEFNLLIDKMDVTYDWEALVMGLTGSSEPHWGANIWKSDTVVRIDPASGQVTEIIDASPVVLDAAPRGSESVLNGIAYHGNSGHFFLTGKNWATVYEVEIK